MYCFEFYYFYGSGLECFVCTQIKGKEKNKDDYTMLNYDAENGLSRVYVSLKI